MPIPTQSNPESLGAIADSAVFFGHQSVGMNILDGVPEVYASAGVTAPEVIQSSAPPNTQSAIAHEFVGVNGDPASKTAAFADRLRSGYGDWADVAFMKLCYVDVTAASDPEAIFADYKATLDALEAEYPHTVFLHLTAPLTTEPGLTNRLKVMVGRGTDHVGDNVVRQKYNELVRKAYGDTGRLVDVAEMESTAPTGERVSGESDGDPYYALYEGYAADPGHLNDLGARVVAAGLLDVIGQNLGE